MTLHARALAALLALAPVPAFAQATSVLVAKDGNTPSVAVNLGVSLYNGPTYCGSNVTCILPRQEQTVGGLPVSLSNPLPVRFNGTPGVNILSLPNPAALTYVAIAFPNLTAGQAVTEFSSVANGCSLFNPAGGDVILVDPAGPASPNSPSSVPVNPGSGWTCAGAGGAISVYSPTDTTLRGYAY